MIEKITIEKQRVLTLSDIDIGETFCFLDTDDDDDIYITTDNGHFVSLYNGYEYRRDDEAECRPIKTLDLKLKEQK